MIEDAIYTIGQAAAGLTALIGTRLYPSGVQERPTAPFVVYDKEDPIPVAGIHVDSGWYHTTFTFMAAATTARAAAALIAQVRVAYQRYNATVGSHIIDDIKAMPNGSSYYDEELELFIEEIELEVFHN